MSVLENVGGSTVRNYYTQQIQRLICLLFVLEEMPRRPARKQEVIEYIRQRRYLDIRPEDLERYITQTEPRWNTDIAFRRKDGVEWGLLFNNQRDCWDLTRDGIELLERVKTACSAKEYDVRECYLWTKYLKKALDSSYEPSPADKPRPQGKSTKWLFKEFSL
jgi:hypothetical protein